MHHRGLRSDAQRCRVKPSPLYATTDTNGTTIYEDNKLNKITFSKVIQLATSNNGADASTDSRMSRMLGYSGTAANSPLTINTGASAYSAFNLAITDPDNTGSLISYVTQGRFYEHDADSNQKITFGSGANMTQVSMSPRSSRISMSRPEPASQPISARSG